VLGEAIELVQKRYDAKNVALLAALEESLPPAPADAAGIHQAVLNLLNNALEAVEEGNGAVTLSTEFDAEAARVRIVVADNGVGIDPERRKHLFEPFYSTKGQKGTGLGLAVTKKIVDEHAGTIRFESTQGQGTTFTIELPTTAEVVASPADTAGPAGRADDEDTEDQTEPGP
jgi:signal transduction histidine kinase